MPITYDPDTNTIVITGTKNGNPYSFEDIYQADVNNGWNKFTKLSEGVYKTTAKLQFGDGSTETWFEEKGTTLIIENTASKDWDVIITFKANCNATFGEYEEVNGVKVVKNGVVFIFRETTYTMGAFAHKDNSDVRYYGCKFKLAQDSKPVRVQRSIKELIGCTTETALTNLNGTIVNTLLLQGVRGYIYDTITATFENVLAVTTQPHIVEQGNSSITFRNLVGYSSNCLEQTYRLQSPNVHKYVNCKPHNWKVRWCLAEGDVSGEIQRVYAVVFKVTDVNGNPLANREIKVYDRNGNKVAEAVTDSNGLTDEVEILYAKLTNPYADNTWHEFTDEDWEYFNPFTIEVYYGNELEYKGILTELDVDSTFIHITVKPSSTTLDDIANKLEYLRKLLGNRWKIENNELLIFDDDKKTIIRRFKLYDDKGRPSSTNVYDRVPVD